MALSNSSGLHYNISNPQRKLDQVFMGVSPVHGAETFVNLPRRSLIKASLAIPSVCVRALSYIYFIITKEAA